jgi:DNA topoisomerase-3
LRLIEKGEYSVKQFKKELIEMIVEITNNVKFAEDKKIAVAKSVVKDKKKRSPKKVINIESLTCPKCKKAKLLKGKTAYGCADYSNGCKFIIPYELGGKKLTSKQISDLITKGKTTKIKGFTNKNNQSKMNGYLYLNDDYSLAFEKE